MGIPQDNMNFNLSSSNPHSKRRRFTPNGSFPPIIPVSDNRSIEQHTFDSPLLLQLCEQAPLPEQIQADLLQVGMRIRKAVTEGYKTHKFTPRPFFNMQRLSPQTQAAITGSPDRNSPDRFPYHAGGPHNVGSMAMQPIATATFCGINLSALSDSNGWGGPLFSSQSLWSYSTSHKRRIELDEDSDEQDWSPQTPTLMAQAGTGMPIDYFNIDMENMCDVSPTTQIHRHHRQNSFPFKQTTMPELNMMEGRKVAKPKSRVRNAVPLAGPPTLFNPFANMAMIPEQEHACQPTPVMMSCGMELNMNGNEFGDAGFLQRREDVEMDCS
jgi:Ribonucleotide reductase inhibitor